MVNHRDSWARVLFSLLVLTSWATYQASAQGTASSIQVINETAPGTSGPIALGVSTKFTTALVNMANTLRDWQLQGAGTLSPGGGINGWASYTPPEVMPANPTVIITAYMDSTPSVTSSYTITLVNPVPTVTSVSPAQLQTGGTQTVTLTGSGFVSGTTVLFNGATLPVTCKTFHSATVQVPVPANASGTLSLQAQNPSPGGGAGSTFTETVATPSISLTATDGDGTNTGTAELGVNVTMSAAVTGSLQTAVNWSMTGPGSISSAGVYTAPAAMPASQAVTIQATLASNPAITASYSLNILNPVPTVTSATPAQLQTGGTQTVSLTGSGFVPGTTVLFNGATLPTTYNSFTKATVQVPVPANATGTLSLQAQNPSPGGGAGSTFTETVATPSISLTATDADGTNTGTAELGVNVTMSAAVTGSLQTAVNWSVTGAGSISSAGVYTAPAAMPASQAVTIQATLASNPAITASYSLNIVNPVPVITSVSPAIVPAGSTTPVTLTGTGFVPGTVIQVNGAAAPTTYQSATSVIAQVTAAAGSTTLSLLGQNPSPVVGTASAFSLAVGSIQVINESAPGTSGPIALGGVSTTFTTTLVNLSNTLRDWQLQGAGTLSPGGGINGWAMYTPPQVMPANPTVTVTAYMDSTPAATSSYTITLVNPVPTVTSATPAQLQTGGTQTVSLTGSGFVSGTTVLFNGATLPITYNSFTAATVQVPVPANATGTLSLQAQNPSPGGGAGSTFTETVATPSISLTATDADGTNTGTAELGVNVTMSAAVTGSLQTAVNWSVTGAGSISSAGVYTAPAAMPASQAVTIQATLASNPAITASYSLNIVNPVPVITSVSPAIVPAGSTTAVTLTGTGFVPGTVIQVNGAAAPTTYQSATSVIAQITSAAGSTTLSLLGQNPSPVGGTAKAFSLAVGSIQVINETAPGTSGPIALGGVSTKFTTALVNLSNTLRDWQLQGAGTLSPGGGINGWASYTPPQVMPANPTVTVTAYMDSTPAATSSYTITLVNPVPTVTSATPAQLQTGGTQTVSLVGSGFVPGTTVLFNGATLPITYNSFTKATVQVPVPSNATGTLSLQAQNPSPGGGAGSTFTETVATPSISLTATDADGTNTGTAELGVNVTMSAAVTGSLQTAVNWSVTGAGSISSAGVYTAPAAMPASQAVTIQATLASNPAITASYSLNIVNPVPVITSVSPAIVPAGSTTPVTLTGTGFVPGTVIQVNGAAAPTTYQSATSVIAQVTAAAGSTTLSLLGQNPSPVGGTAKAFSLAVGSIQVINETAPGTSGPIALGVSTTFTTGLVNLSNTLRDWQLQGAGTLSPGGGINGWAKYTPPQVMPANPTVTVTAYMDSTPAATSSYTITLVNPVPTVTSATPAQLQTGGTQTVSLVGSGFEPGMTIAFSGASLPITYNSYTTATVQVPVPANASGTLSLQAQNPSPGGGAGSTFTESVVPNSIALTATDADGTNTGTAELGVTVAMSAAVTGSLQTAVNWSVTGPGSISSAGVYTAPAAMPASQAVTIQATLASNPAITASYSLNIVNPVPVVTSVSPLLLPPGATTPVTLTGTGFVPQTVILVAGTAVPTTYESATAVVATITVPANETGSVTLKGQNPTPGGGLGPEFEQAIAGAISATAAARLFGPNHLRANHQPDPARPARRRHGLAGRAVQHSANGAGHYPRGLPKLLQHGGVLSGLGMVGCGADGQRSAAAAGGLRPERAVCGLQRGRRRPGNQLLHEYAGQRCVHELVHHHERRDSLSGHGYLPQHAQQSKAVRDVDCQRELRPREHAAVQPRPRPDQPGWKPAAGRQWQSHSGLHPGTGAGFRPGLHGLDLCQPGRLHPLGTYLRGERLSPSGRHRESA